MRVCVHVYVCMQVCMCVCALSTWMSQLSRPFIAYQLFIPVLAAQHHQIILHTIVYQLLGYKVSIKSVTLIAAILISSLLV